MVQYEEALKKVRDECDNLIISSSETENEYCFTISGGKDFMPGDLASCNVLINKKDGSMSYETEVDDEIPGTLKYIDVTEEQVRQAVKSIFKNIKFS